MGIVRTPKNTIFSHEIEHRADGSLFRFRHEVTIALDVLARLKFERWLHKGSKEIVLLIQPIHQVGRESASCLDRDQFQCWKSIKYTVDNH